MRMSRNSIIDKAIHTWGEDAQLNCAVEELAELIQAITKHKRGYDNYENIVEEIADVRIMIEQLIKICDIKEQEIQEVEEYKLKRLQKRLEV